MAFPAKMKLPAIQESTYASRLPGIDRTFEFRFHAAFLPGLVLVGRLLFGFFFLWSGLAKVIHDGEWMGFAWFKGSAETGGELFTFLNYSTGPLHGFWSDVANNATAMDVLSVLVPVGQVLIGIGLLLGLLTRLSLLSAGLMMAVFYSVNLWPLYNPFLNEYVFYIGIFAVLGALGAGRVLGIDQLIEQRRLVHGRPWLGWLLG